MEDVRTKYRQLYPFKCKDFECAAWFALEDTYGPCGEWTPQQSYCARQFLSRVCNMRSEGFNLAVFKAGIDIGNASRDMQYHLPAYHFLRHIRGLYNAPDRKDFRVLMKILEGSERLHRIIFSKDVHTFSDIVRLHRGDQWILYAIPDDGTLPTAIIRDFVNRGDWKMSGRQTRDLFLLMISALRKAKDGHPIDSIADFNTNVFFNLIDFARAQKCDVSVLVSNFIHLYFFLIKCWGLKPDTAYIEKDKLSSTETVRFFNNTYISREATALLRIRKSTSCQFVTINVANPAVRSVYRGLLESGGLAREDWQTCGEHLTACLGRHIGRLHTIDDWDESVLFAMVDYFNGLLAGEKHRTYAMSFIRALFLYINTIGNGAFFSNAATVTYKLLTSSRFVNYCVEGWQFRVFSPYEKYDDCKKVVFIVYGFNRGTRKMLTEDDISVDFSMIQNPYYRTLAMRCVTSKPGRLYRTSLQLTLRELLPLLVKLKGLDKWYTPDLKAFSYYDALVVASAVESATSSDLTYNRIMLDVRDFVRWAEGAGELMVDPIVYDMMANKKVSGKVTNRPIVPQEHVTKLTAYMAQEAKKNPIWGQALIILNLACITPLRVISICGIQRSKLTYSDSLSSYILKDTFKSTNGEDDELVMGFRADQFIAKAMRISAQVGLECPQESLRDYLFIYTERNHYGVFTTRKFTTMLNKALKACELPHYTALNLRATYMTNGYIDAVKNGVVDEFTLKVHSTHRSAKTTLQHYVNHDEGLARLIESLNRGADWQRTIAPDEAASLKATLDELQEIYLDTEDESQKLILENQIADIKAKINKIVYK